jgi:hypothetical protein
MIEADPSGFSAPARDFKAAMPADVGPAARESSYVWNLTTDEIEWDANARNVLGITDLSRIATGRAYAGLHDANAVENQLERTPRHETINAVQHVRYHTKYWIYPCAGTMERLWVEEIGTWHRDDKKVPVLARGVVRVLAEEPS